MSRIWANASLTSGIPEADFKKYALTLVCGQVLYHSNPQHRTAYLLIKEHRTTFTEVLDYLGLRLGIDDEYRMIYIVPEEELDRPVSQDETLLALVLRRIHHDRSSLGQADNGIVTITLGDLYSTYQTLTSKDLPKGPGAAKERETLLEAMRRYGFIRKVDTEPESEFPYDIQILPGIVALISEDVLSRLRGDALADGSTTNDTPGG